MSKLRRLPSSTVRLRPEQLEDRAVPAVYTVTGFADEVLPGTITPTGTDTFNASSLRAAVLAANQTTADDTIVLGAGTFSLTVEGTFENGGATGDLDVAAESVGGALTVVGAGAGATTVRGDFVTVKDRLFDTTDGKLTFQNLTLSGGTAPSYGGIEGYGGAVRAVNSSDLTLTGVIASGNTAYSGGAVGFSSYSYGFFFFAGNTNAGSLTISNSTISGNTAAGSPTSTYNSGYGGGVSFIGFGAPLAISDSVISGNSATGGRGAGGGLSIYAGFAEASITRTVISGNTAQSARTTSQGGGIAGFTYGNSLTITDSTISGNTVTGGSYGGSVGDAYGGGISVRGGLTLVRSTVSDNTAKGGSFLNYGGNVTARAGYGGGIFFTGAEGGSLSIVNSTVSGNDAVGGDASATGTQVLTAGSAFGGGLFFTSFSYGGFTGTASIRNSTFADNSATAGTATSTGGGTENAGVAYGGGIVVENAYGSLSVGSSIVATNTVANPEDPAQAFDPDVSGVFVSGGRNLIGILGAATGFANGVGGDLVGTAAAPLDPVIGPLAANGGPTRTHALLPGSPAINAGSNLSAQTTDQRGANFYRVFGGAADIGAYEVQTAYVPYLSVGSQNGEAQLRVLNADGSTKFANLDPFPGFTGEVFTATADFNGDRIDDIVAGAGVGGGPRVVVFDGATGNQIASFFAFENFARGGVALGVGDVNGDGVPDVITGAGVGGGPRVRVIDGTKLNSVDADGVITSDATLLSFFAFDQNWRGGITVTFADGQFVVGRGGVSNGISVAAEVALADLTGKVTKVFGVLDSSFVGPITVAAGLGTIAVGAGVGGSPRVELYNTTGGKFDDFPAFDPTFFGGANVGIFGFGDQLSLVVGAGPGGGPQVVRYTLQGDFIDSFAGLDLDYSGGVFVG